MWTTKNRAKYNRDCLRYPSDVTDVLDRIHHTLYVACREKLEREASPTAAIIDSQSVKSAEKGGPPLIRMVSTRARKSRVRSATFS